MGDSHGDQHDRQPHRARGRGRTTENDPSKSRYPNRLRQHGTDVRNVLPLPSSARPVHRSHARDVVPGRPDARCGARRDAVAWLCERAPLWVVFHVSVLLRDA
jgi:hypothetical protein